MNAKQIEKLQRKVNKTLEPKFKERDRKEAEEKSKKKKDHGKYMISLKQDILKVEKEFPNRGPVVCRHRDISYAIYGDRVIVVNMKIDDGVEIVTTIGDREFLLMKEEVYKTEIVDKREFFEWVSDNYAKIRAAIVSIDRGDLSQALLLGELINQMRDKFPSRSIADLKDAVNMFDTLIRDL